jgi:SagB-type dehydrogenase family enzyme
VTDDALSPVFRYHDGTKHHFNRFARSLGYLDWASQPDPFRSYVGAAQVPLYPSPAATPGIVGYSPRDTGYRDLLDTSTRRPETLSAASVGDLLRHAFGLSAWKAFRASRWSLRVNPSSGNLHPTEIYIVCGPEIGLDDVPGVFHYATDRHALEHRCAFDGASWRDAVGERSDVLLLALTSIHWREAWKYGERAFRYCQHDLGHAIAAAALAASILGWRVELMPCSSDTIAGLTGVDRDEDFVDAEREEPGCVLRLDAGRSPAPLLKLASLSAAVQAGRWAGRASQLSDDHVQWTFIDEVAAATRPAAQQPSETGHRTVVDHARFDHVYSGTGGARRVVLRRRSAVAFDGRSSVDRDRFLAMLARVMPETAPPWESVWWPPRAHLVLFVHRVADVEPGLYVLARRAEAVDTLRSAMQRQFVWAPADASLPLFQLARGDCRRLAARLSCDQDIAADGFFSLGMLVEFEAALRADGPSAYRRLFWETGMVGQVLYLEAEALGARATGIGCFYDDPVHEVLGLSGHALQSLYHFTVGIPIEDARLTTEPGYVWEARI